MCVVAPGEREGTRRAFFVAKGQVVCARPVPRARSGLEWQAGLAAVARAEPTLAPEAADELLVVAAFLRRPPPELEVVPLAHFAAWTSSASSALGDGWRKLVADGVTATPVTLRRGPAVKVVDGPRTETVPREDWPARLDALLEHARNVHLLAPDGDVHARRTKKGSWLVSRGKPSSERRSSARTTARGSIRCPQDHPLFARDEDLARQGAAGAALRRAAARAAAVGARAHPRRRRRLRQGVHEPRARRLRPRGRDARRARRARHERSGDRDRARRSRTELGYDEARFEATSIDAYETDEPIDLLVSLHACDTATDEAIAAGVRLGAEAIVVAPCCHHELAAQIARSEKDGLLRHGLLLGRQADLVTDALRAAALETLGYRVDVIEFVSAEHTAKNVMLRAERAPSAPRAARAARRVRGAARPVGRRPGDRAPARLPVSAGR